VHRTVGVLLVLGLAAACTPHPVGPARTFDDYERKAGTTAESALSAVQTVRLTAETASAGDAFGPYSSIVISDQEDAIAGVQGTFGSIQPPNTDADALRDELDQILGDALTHVTEVRIAVRRGQLEQLADVAAPLAGDVESLERFIEDHG
jgi:hypothetical protein